MNSLLSHFKTIGCGHTVRTLFQQSHRTLAYVSNKRITRIRSDTEVDKSELETTGNESFVNVRLVNRNPRNLEQMLLESKPMGYELDSPNRHYWNKMVFEKKPKHIVASIVHHSGRTLVSASSSEAPIAAHLSSRTGLEAAQLLGQILTMRAFESGIHSVFFDHIKDRESKKEKIKLSAHDVKLLEKKGVYMQDPLNSGSFACVYRATFNDRQVAAKVIDLEKTSDDYRIKFLPREIYTMKKLKHKYLIEILDIFVVGNRVFVFMELAEGGDFLDLLRATKALPESRARYFYRQFGDALRYMHSLGFAHRDIKCENILLNKARTEAKLTDFGFTRSVNEKQTGNQMLSETYCGSAAYVAPEVLKAQPYNAIESDVWSMGVVLFVLVQNRLPFGDRDTKKLLASQLERKYKFMKNISRQLRDLIEQHLDPNPTTRASMETVLAHEWFGIEQSDSNESQCE
ncbi:Kinase-like [Blomia tropicalis]|nr:Kinase-like [Blomia tropicalis]